MVLGPPGWDGLCCSVGLRLPPKSLASQPIGLREVKGVGGDLEALPAGVDPLPALPLQLYPDFSTPLVCIRDQSAGMEDFRAGMGGSLGTLQQAWTILPQTQQSGIPAPQIFSTDPSLLLTLKGKVPFFLEPSCKIFPELCVVLSVPC